MLQVVSGIAEIEIDPCPLHAAPQAATAAEAEDASEPVDDLQTHCALSGERFEQYWEERYQEWRYRGAKRLSAEEAAR